MSSLVPHENLNCNASSVTLHGELPILVKSILDSRYVSGSSTITYKFRLYKKPLVQMYFTKN